MAQLQRAEGQTELKCHADKFFDTWSCKLHLVPNMCPDKLPKIELNEGEWGKVGAVYTWNYHFKEIGEHAFLKTKIEESNEEKRCLEYNLHGGLMMDKYYKTFKSKFQVTPKKEGCIVKWSFEYEKFNENVPDPKYIDFLLGAAKDVDACLCSA